MLLLKKIFLLFMLIAWTIGGVGAIFFRKSSATRKYFPYATVFLGSIFGLFTSINIFINEVSLSLNLWSITSFFQLSFSLNVLSALFRSEERRVGKSLNH